MQAQAVTAEFQGLKVFSATKFNDRNALGEVVTQWISDSGVRVVTVVVSQSSDSEFHCLTLTVFYTKMTS